MVYNSLQEYLAAVDAGVFENVSGSVTAVIINDLLKGAAEQNWVTAQKGDNVVISTTPLIVTFPVAFTDNIYGLLIRCYDAAGDPVDYRITDVLAGSFTITGAVAGFIDWRAEK